MYNKKEKTQAGVWQKMSEDTFITYTKGQVSREILNQLLNDNI